MSGHRITLPGSVNEELSDWLDSHPSGHERGALILFRKFDRPATDMKPSVRYVAVECIKLDDDWIIESSQVHLRINLRKLPPVYLRCEQEGLELGFVHSHPSGAFNFSTKDNQNEQNILRGYAGCNGIDVCLVAMILVDGQWFARCRSGLRPSETQTVRHVSVAAHDLRIHLPLSEGEISDIQKRQEAAFGKPFNQKLASLRVAVVGAGGTGSSVATLLARAGVGEIIIVDGDKLEASNLNRVRGYRLKDVGQNKAKTLANFIKDLDLPIRVSYVEEYLNESPTGIDALSGCDVVFGCTDDVAGRDLINQALYYYFLAYIDTGLTGLIDHDSCGQPYLRDHRGRVSTILPEHGSCLRCQKVVTEDKLKYEQALRDNPDLANLDAETLKREYYLTGGGESAPGVGPFTSATADYAVASFMNLIRPYRKLDTDLRQDNIWYDFVHLQIHSNTPMIDSNCFCCGSSGLRNAAEGGYRLGMPQLGKIE